MTLNGKRILVTGASGGIGAAICEFLAADGASVVGTGRDAERLAETLTKLDVSCGQTHSSVFMEIANKESVAEGVKKACEFLGGLDVLVNNAGVSAMNHLEDISEEEWDFNFNGNVKGAFFVTQAALPYLKESRGTIVNIASLAAKKALPLLTHYSASKFAVLGFTKACAIELADYSINVNCICPGLVKTAMQDREVIWEGKLRGMEPEAVRQEYIDTTPLHRLCYPEDVAKAVKFLASEDAKFITGEALSVCGGLCSK